MRATGTYLELASEVGEEKELVACRPEGGAGFRCQAGCLQASRRRLCGLQREEGLSSAVLASALPSKLSSGRKRSVTSRLLEDDRSPF